MLADPEEVDADLVGKHPLLDDIPNRLRMRLRAVVLVVGPVAERVEPQDERKLRIHDVSVRHGAATSHPPLASRDRRLAPLARCGHVRSSRQHGDREIAALAEPELSVEADCAGVGGEDV